MPFANRYKNRFCIQKSFRISAERVLGIPFAAGKRLLLSVRHFYKNRFSLKFTIQSKKKQKANFILLSVFLLSCWFLEESSANNIYFSFFCIRSRKSFNRCFTLGVSKYRSRCSFNGIPERNANKNRRFSPFRSLLARMFALSSSNRTTIWCSAANSRIRRTSRNE